MSDPRRVWITGLGLVTSIGTRGRRLRAASPRDLTDPGHRPIRRQPLPLPGRGADRRLRPGRPHGRQIGPCAGPIQPVRRRRRPAGAGRCRVPTGRAWSPRSSAGGIFLGAARSVASRRRGAARAVHGRRHPTAAPTLALAVFGGAAPANLGITLGVQADPVHRQLVRPGRSRWGRRCWGPFVRRGRRRHRRRGRAARSPLSFGAFDLIRALANAHTTTWTRPAVRSTRLAAVVLGEGAALLVLEEAEAARRRGAVPYAELRGYGASSDAYHMVQPRPDGSDAARAARYALTDAGDLPESIDYVNAHASSTPLGDVSPRPAPSSSRSTVGRRRCPCPGRRPSRGTRWVRPRPSRPPWRRSPSAMDGLRHRSTSRSLMIGRCSEASSAILADCRETHSVLDLVRVRRAERRPRVRRGRLNRMAVKLTWPQVLAWRMERSFLEPIGGASVTEVVRRLCGAVTGCIVRRPGDPAPPRVLEARRCHRGARGWPADQDLGHARRPAPIPCRGRPDVPVAHVRRRPVGSWGRYLGMTAAEMDALREAMLGALQDEPLTKAELAAAVAAKLGPGPATEALKSSWGGLLTPLAGRRPVLRPEPWHASDVHDARARQLALAGQGRRRRGNSPRHLRPSGPMARRRSTPLSRWLASATSKRKIRRGSTGCAIG